MDAKTFWEKTKTVCKCIWKYLKLAWKGISFVWNNSSDWLKAVYIIGGCILIGAIITNTKKVQPANPPKPLSQETLLSRIKYAYECKDTLDIKDVICYNSQHERYWDVQDSADYYLRLLREEAVELNKHRKATFQCLKSSHDDFDGTTWYKNPYFTHKDFSNNVSAYIGKSGKKIWMRLVVTYCGNDWIFFDDCMMKFGLDQFPVVFNKYDKKTDVSGGLVYEKIDKPLEALEMSYLYDVLSRRDKGQIRLTGKYQKTRDLTNNEIKGLRDVLDAYIYMLSDGCEGEPIVVMKKNSKNGPTAEQYRRLIKK